jgi:hypothetical protein
MNVRAVRGVCIGPGRHLAAGEVADLDASLARWLQNIGAVVPVPSAAAEPAHEQPQPTARKQRMKEDSNAQ